MVWLSDLSSTLQEFMELGGDVLWAIMLVLLLMWTFILERLWYFKMIHPKRVREIIANWDARVDTTSWHARQIREAIDSGNGPEFFNSVLPERGDPRELAARWNEDLPDPIPGARAPCGEWTGRGSPRRQFLPPTS